jgi:hypothetical protein
MHLQSAKATRDREGLVTPVRVAVSTLGQGVAHTLAPEVVLIPAQVAVSTPGRVLTALLAGLRWGECAALVKSDIDWQRGRIHVQRTFSEKGSSIESCKDGEDRWVWASPALLKALRTHLDAIDLEGQVPGVATRAEPAGVSHRHRPNHPAQARPRRERTSDFMNEPPLLVVMDSVSVPWRGRWPQWPFRAMAGAMASMAVVMASDAPSSENVSTSGACESIGTVMMSQRTG